MILQRNFYQAPSHVVFGNTIRNFLYVADLQNPHRLLKTATGVGL
jgi:hypothetical protein